jgi:hypothetical protein
MPSARECNKKLLVILFCLLAGFSAVALAQTEQPRPEQFSATVYAQSGVFAGRMTQFTIYIAEYTPDDEANQLKTLLKTKGEDALLNTVEKMKGKGQVAAVGTIGWPIPVIRQHPEKDGGRRIVLFGNRPLSFFEARDRPISAEYRFGLMVLHLNAKGEGQGLLYPACKVKFNKQGILDVENFGISPWKVVNVRKEK